MAAPLQCTVRRKDNNDLEVMFGGCPESLLAVDYSMVDHFKPIAEQFGFRRKAFSDVSQSEYYEAISPKTLKLGEWISLICHGQEDQALHHQAPEQAQKKVQAGG